MKRDMGDSNETEVRIDVMERLHLENPLLTAFGAKRTILTLGTAVPDLEVPCELAKICEAHRSALRTILSSRRDLLDARQRIPLYLSSDQPKMREIGRSFSNLSLLRKSLENALNKNQKAEWADADADAALEMGPELVHLVQECLNDKMPVDDLFFDSREGMRDEGAMRQILGAILVAPALVMTLPLLAIRQVLGAILVAVMTASPIGKIAILRRDFGESIQNINDNIGTTVRNNLMDAGDGDMDCVSRDERRLLAHELYSLQCLLERMKQVKYYDKEARSKLGILVNEALRHINMWTP